MGISQLSWQFSTLWTWLKTSITWPFFSPVILGTIPDESLVFYSIFFSIPFSPGTFASSQCFSFILCLDKTMWLFTDIHFVLGLQFHFSFHRGLSVLLSRPFTKVDRDLTVFQFSTGPHCCILCTVSTFFNLTVCGSFEACPQRGNRKAVYCREALTLDLLNRSSRSETVKHRAVISVSAEVVIPVNTK